MDRVVSSSLRRQKALPGWISSESFAFDCSRNLGNLVLVVAGILWQVAVRMLVLAQCGYWAAAGQEGVDAGTGKCRQFRLRERFGESYGCFLGVLLLIPWGGMNESRPWYY
ncbi:hypothetical protein [Candidatus Nitrotoga fabula]|uniref:Uncharacterized protein n=1 Tax=Candidatus Nitrotoga fabula TaxID=2182327 RepID=A0A916F9W0_9PROT|nr:hypothetical protein [Candidatus Nitrotoga fabula]CAE6739635.1 hypothetical protein NTGZN8_90032 [Candidatus Nitrotoga fabula]